MRGEKNQYATFKLPAKHPCERTSDRSVFRFPLAMEVRAKRRVRVNEQKGTITPLGPWTFIRIDSAYYFDAAGLEPRDEHLA